VVFFLGVKEIVVGEGNSYEEALADVKICHPFPHRNFWTRRSRRYLTLPFRM